MGASRHDGGGVGPGDMAGLRTARDPAWLIDLLSEMNGCRDWARSGDVALEAGEDHRLHWLFSLGVDTLLCGMKHLGMQYLPT